MAAFFNRMKTTRSASGSIESVDDEITPLVFAESIAVRQTWNLQIRRKCVDAKENACRSIRGIGHRRDILRI